MIGIGKALPTSQLGRHYFLVVLRGMKPDAKCRKSGPTVHRSSGQSIGLAIFLCFLTVYVDEKACLAATLTYGRLVM